VAKQPAAKRQTPKIDSVHLVNDGFICFSFMLLQNANAFTGPNLIHFNYSSQVVNNAFDGLLFKIEGEIDFLSDWDDDEGSLRFFESIKIRRGDIKERS